MTKHDANLKPTFTTLAVCAMCLAIILLLIPGCGDNTELKLDQAKIALANKKPDRAMSLVDSVLASDPGNPQAMLIQARAQVELGRLGPAKLTLQRLAKQQPDNPEIAAALLECAIRTIDNALENTAFATTELDLQAYDESLQIAQAQLDALRKHESAADLVTFNEALLSRGELNHARAMITHTKRMINQLGADALVDTTSAAQQNPTEDAAEELTYGKQLEDYQKAEADALEQMLTSLESLLTRNPAHTQAAALFLRTTALEEQWDRLLAQAARFTEASPLPVETAQRTISMILGVPDSVSPLSVRIELGRSLLRATPADQSESEPRLVSSARLMFAVGETQKALPILAKLIEEHDSSDAGTYMLYAQALYDAGDDAKCREILERMLPEMESVSMVQTLYGMTLWRLGDVR